MSFNPYSIGFWITRRAELTPSRVALDFEDREYSYAELNDGANRAASALEASGVKRGDRVAMLSDNRPEYIEVFFACAKLGVVLVPVSWRLAEPEMIWQLEDSSPTALVVSPDWADTGGRIFDGPILELPLNGETTEHHDVCTWDDSLMILYTSGTTGRPKGAVLTHGNFFWGNLNMLVNADIDGDDVSLMFLPMFHIGGWNVNTLPVLLKGGKIVLERTFDATRSLDLIAKKQVTWLMGVPATYLFMSQQPGFQSADFSSVKTMVVGGAPMPETLLQTYAAKGIDIVQGYGLTELSPNALLLPMQDASRKLGSAGKPYFFTDTRLSDDGEIIAAGPVVMQGYWNRPDATDETIRDGWLHTGDVGRVDDEGFFWVVDRKKDMIISGGENIYPAEIENVIYEHPSIAEAAVIGIPDDKWGESVRAIVVAKEGMELSVDDVLQHCLTRLAAFKVPRSLELRKDPLPRTPAGKVKKTELREPFWEGHSKSI
ncbi:MAG: long-chain fatty acid--CoA ligase [Actinomycetota bacterium]